MKLEPISPKHGVLVFRTSKTEKYQKALNSVFNDGGKKLKNKLDNSFSSELSESNSSDQLADSGLPETMEIMLETKSPHLGENWLDFGLVDSTLKEKLVDVHDWRTKQQGVEELRFLILSMSDVGPLIPHIRQFLVFLDYLLEDINFKVLLCTFEIYDSILEKLQAKLRPHLKQLVNSLIKHVGNTQVVVRMTCCRILTNLMHITSPKDVVGIVKENLKHKTSKVA